MLLKIFWYIVRDFFMFPINKQGYRQFHVEIKNKDEEPEIMCWGICTEKGWESIKNNNGRT